MFNLFRKKKNTGNDNKVSDEVSETAVVPKMNMLQRLAMKRMERMSPSERQKLMQKALSPENVAKHKDEILATMQQMRASGQISDEQVAAAKKQLGL